MIIGFVLEAKPFRVSSTNISQELSHVSGDSAVVLNCSQPFEIFVTMALMNLG